MVSFLRRCFAAAFLAVISYIGQPGAEQIVPESYADEQHVTRAPSHSSTADTASPLQQIAAHTFSSAEIVCISVVVLISVVRFLFMLYSVLYLRIFDRNPIKSQSVDSDTEGIISGSSHDYSKAEAV